MYSEKLVYIVGYTIDSTKNRINVFAKDEDGNLIILKYGFTIDKKVSVMFMEYEDIYYDSVHPAIIKNPKFKDIEKLKFFIPSELSMLVLYDCPIIGINLLENTMDSDIWVWNNLVDNEDYIKPISISKEQKEIKEKIELEELKKDLEKLNKSLSDAQEVIYNQANEINRLLNQNIKLKNEVNKFIDSFRELLYK